MNYNTIVAIHELRNTLRVLLYKTQYLSILLYLPTTRQSGVVFLRYATKDTGVKTPQGQKGIFSYYRGQPRAPVFSRVIDLRFYFLSLCLSSNKGLGSAALKVPALTSNKSDRKKNPRGYRGLILLRFTPKITYQSNYQRTK